MASENNFMLRHLPLLLLTFLLLGFSNEGYAQQQGSENSLLPEINPQDIEIRSQFKARFPGLRRQPILGFDPSPRVYQISSNRTPFMETQEQVIASLPVSELSRPVPPSYNALNYSSDIRAIGKVGFGSFGSPIGKFWGVHRFNNKSYIGADLDYSSSSGHLDDQLSSFRFFSGNIDYATKLTNKTQLHLTAGGQSDFNYLPETPRQAAASPKNYTGFNLTADIQHRKNTVEGWTAKAEVRNFTSDLQGNPGFSNQDELVYGGSFKKQWAGGNINETFAVSAGTRGGNYSGATATQQSWATLRAGGEYSRLLNYTTKITGRAEVYYVSNFLGEKIYFAPLLQVDHSFSDRLTLSANAGAKPAFNTVEDHHQINRFLANNNQFVHTYSMDVSAKASLKYYRGSTLEGGISYQNADNYAFYFRQVTSFGTQRRFYRVNYQNATNFKVFAGITHQLAAEKFWLSAQIYLQNPKLSNGNRIPFEEQWGINASTSLRLFNRLTIEGWADYIGAREQFTSTDKLDGFLLVGTEGEIEITEKVGAFVKAVNLLSQEYEIWDGYTERPFQIYGGITVKL